MTIGNPNIVSSSTKNLVGTPQTQNERSSLNKAITKTKTMPPQNSNPTSSATASVKKQLCYRTDSLPIHSMRIAAAAAEKCSKRTAVVREPSLLDTTPNILAKNSK
jgi:hypothetical protein